MATVLDYRDREVDLLAWQGGAVNSLVTLEPALATPGNPGLVVAGIEKLVQRFLLEFLTETGSIVHLPDRGCSFMTVARQGRLRTVLDVQQAFRIAVTEIRRNLQAEELDTDPADERFSDATLEQASISGDSLTMRIRLTSLAGTSRTFLAPIPVVPRLL